MDTNTIWLLLLSALAMAGLALGVLILHKTRRVHLATYTLLEDLSATRKETEALFGQIHALLALERKLSLPQALPPMRGWAASPDFLLVVANEVLKRKSKTVMECSSGVSTLVVARCLQINGMGHVFSLEHDAHYAAKTRDLIEHYGLSEWATVLNAPLVTQHTETPWYSEESIPEDLGPIDLLIIDGPPSDASALARFPAVPRLARRMTDPSIIILDDANRPDEIEIVKRWKSMVPSLTETRPVCEKGCALLQLCKPTKSDPWAAKQEVYTPHA